MDDFSAALPRPVSPMVRGLSMLLTVIGLASFLLSARGDTAAMGADRRRTLLPGGV